MDYKRYQYEQGFYGISVIYSESNIFIDYCKQDGF